MKLFVGLILFSGVFSNESTDASSDGEAVVETVADEAPPAQASASEELPGVQDPVTQNGQAKKAHRERIYTEEEKKQMRQLMREREEYNRQVKHSEENFILIDLCTTIGPIELQCNQICVRNTLFLKPILSSCLQKNDSTSIK